MDRILDAVAAAPVKSPIVYPESDGKPMGESDFHITAILYLLAALRQFFQQVEDIYVAADMLFYYEEGKPALFVVPDVFVVKGTAKHPRRTYKLWEERLVPSVVFEITSRSTRLDDLTTKRGLYERLGVREYFLFDPLDEYLSPRLQGFRLAEGYYQPMALAPDGSLRSEQLGLILRPEESLLRLVDPETNETLPTLDEAMDLAQEEMKRARVESERARVESEHARVESERAHVESERARVESERARVESERARVEAKRADQAEAELARLRDVLERLRRSAGE
ncbi:MAG: Uma2 family endonuclease [Chloroflexi bacterium]|nr:Uma2 family endonuclease [Chloroflexota bacterium]